MHILSVPWAVLAGGGMTGHWQDFNDAPDQTRPKPEERLTTDDLKERLHGRLREALFHLLPSGKIRNGKFVVGDIQGNKGDSLCVELSGAKIGMWHDFATGDGGDILSLWGAVHGLDPAHAFRRSSAPFMNGSANLSARAQKGTEEAEDLGPHTAKWDYLGRAREPDRLRLSLRHADGKEFRPWDVKARKRRAPEPRPLYNQPAIRTPAPYSLSKAKMRGCAASARHLRHHGHERRQRARGQDRLVAALRQACHDLAGQRRGRKTLRRCRRWQAAHMLGVASLSVLIPPEGKPQGWDVADAVAEGMDVPAFLASAPRMTIPPASALPAFSVGHLLDDDSPMPDDIIAPRVLTPGGLLVLGGAPKVGKTDFLLVLARAHGGGIAVPRHEARQSRSRFSISRRRSATTICANA
jgi:putative DNA primase/helicase